MGCGASNAKKEEEVATPIVPPAGAATTKDSNEPAADKKPEKKAEEAPASAASQAASAALAAEAQKPTPQTESSGTAAAPTEPAKDGAAPAAAAVASSAAPAAETASAAAPAAAAEAKPEVKHEATPADATVKSEHAPTPVVVAAEKPAEPIAAASEKAAEPAPVASEADAATAVAPASTVAHIESQPPVEVAAAIPSSAPVSNKPLKPQAVFVLGGPGSGKGTQCARIVESFGWVHLSAGDLLREERKKGGKTAELIEEYILNGLIVPVEITVQLLKDEITKHVAANRTQFLIDGFPRNLDNLQGWKRVMGSYVELLFVLVFDCTEEVMETRLLSRGLTSGRTDDNATAIKKRFQTFKQDSQPVIDKYHKSGRAHCIDATRTTDEVWADVEKIFKPIDRDTKPLPNLTKQATVVNTQAA